MKRPKCHIPPIKQRNNVWARSDKEKAIAFADHLKRVFQPFPSTRNEQDCKVRNYLASALQMCLPIKCVTPRELVKEIKTMQEGKSPGYDLIDATILKHIPKKSIVFLTTVFNACLRLSYFPSQFKIAQVVMIPKPGKSANEVESYRPISLLPFLSKLLEKIILSRMKPHLQECIPNHQFGFREGHGTIEQVHRLTDVISRTLENKKYCSAVFLDIGQAFDKVWHEGLLYKVKKTLPHCFYNILKSYLSKRCFEVKFNGECSDLHEITSGVPQGSILGPILYLIFTADLPENDNTTTATYADDTALLSVHADPVTATSNLQKHLTEVEEWLNLWRIRANQDKSAHVTFTLRKDTCPPVNLNGETIPQVDSAKYLGMHLDRRLTWRKHIWTKRKQLDTKVRNFTWLIGKHSQLSKNSKITIYKAILKPIWTYGIELWGTASNSNIEILERFQSKTLRNMFNIPWYITNKYIHQDLQMKTVKQEIMCNSMRYQTRLSCHENDLASQLQGTGSLLFSRLKRKSVFTSNNAM